MLGDQICVKRSGKGRAKLDKHNFTEIFSRYTARMANIHYIDLKTELVKTCGHTAYDEAWYCEPQRPTAAQLLYDLGFEQEHPEGNIAKTRETCVFDPPAPDLTLRRPRSTLDVLMACLLLRMGQARRLAGRRIGKPTKEEP